MTPSYAVWLNARCPKTLESVATVRVFVSDDRLKAEAVAERAQSAYPVAAAMLRSLGPAAIVNSEVRNSEKP